MIHQRLMQLLLCLLEVRHNQMYDFRTIAAVEFASITRFGGAATGLEVILMRERVHLILLKEELGVPVLPIRGCLSYPFGRTEDLALLQNFLLLRCFLELILGGTAFTA